MGRSSHRLANGSARPGPGAGLLVALMGLTALALLLPPRVGAEEPAPGRGGNAAQTAEREGALEEAPLVVPSRVRSTPAPRDRRPDGEEPGLDSLLQLPSGFMAERSRPVAGASESEWRRRFDRSVNDLAEAKRTLEKTKRELDEVADSGGASQWSVAPPTGGAGGGGASPTSSPLSFKLRQELKRNRESVEEAERALRELRIEADLAGVPQAWRGSEAGAGETGRN